MLNTPVSKPSRCVITALLGIGLLGLFTLMAAAQSWADIEMVREVLITPKKGSLAANIGPVNQSANIRMTKAEVIVRPGPVPADETAPLRVSVQAKFQLTSESDSKLQLTVGFPVSESEYSSFAVKSFAAVGPGGPRTVFQRVTGYPRYMGHRWVSGPDVSPAGLLPDVAEARKARDGYVTKGRNRPIMKGEMISSSELNNLMVWAETFAPRESKTITVSYTMDIPLQARHWTRRKARGNYKGIWPQEANNLPLNFVKTLPKGRYYFFDYFLKTGASWKGPIGLETVTLVLDQSWRGHRLFCNLMPSLAKTTVPGGNGNMPATAYVYTLRQKEPEANLYFALEKPGSP